TRRGSKIARHAGLANPRRAQHRSRRREFRKSQALRADSALDPRNRPSARVLARAHWARARSHERSPLMENDDILSPILGRREILRGAGALGLLLGFGGLARNRPGRIVAPGEIDLSDLIEPSGMQGMCVMTPAETEGPYYLNLNLLRQDITEGQPG